VLRQREGWTALMKYGGDLWTRPTKTEEDELNRQKGKEGTNECKESSSNSTPQTKGTSLNRRDGRVVVGGGGPWKKKKGSTGKKAQSISIKSQPSKLPHKRKNKNPN